MHPTYASQSFRRRRVRPETIWKKWSFSKLRVLLECPYHFFLSEIKRMPAPEQPLFTAASALHYVASLLWHPKFSWCQSGEDFAKLWRGFWRGVIEKEHGSNNFNPKKSPPVEVAWRSLEEPAIWYGKGSKIMKDFFGRHARNRGFGMGRLREQRFAVDWLGFRLTGVIDRIDQLSRGCDIVDYKLGGTKAHEVDLFELQGTFYRIAFEDSVSESKLLSGGRRNLRSIRTENLQTGELFKLAGDETSVVRQKDRLHRLLLEASVFVEGILTSKTELLVPIEKFRFLHPSSLREHLFLPVLPRDKHCSFCPYLEPCQEFERKGTGRGPACDWIESNEKTRRAAYPGQLELGFEV